jgi:acid phosphatase type 7
VTRGWLLTAAVLLAVAGCKKAPHPVPMTVRAQPVPRGEGVVVVAAAGDISADRPARQAWTADLVLGGDYAAVLLLGDNQYPSGTLDTYQRFFHPSWGRFKDRIYPSPGNHEYQTPNAAGYFQYFGERAGDPGKGYYSFDLGSWHLVALNTSDKCKTVPCGPDSEQLKWLEADLKKSGKKCTLAFWHHPRFSSGSHGDLEQLVPLWNVLHANGVDVVLNGHDHVYERFAAQTPAGEADANGIVQFTVGTGGADLYELKARRKTSAVADAAVHGILALSLGPDGYAWDFVGLSISTFTDKGEGKCH